MADPHCGTHPKMTGAITIHVWQLVPARIFSAPASVQRKKKQQNDEAARGITRTKCRLKVLSQGRRLLVQVADVSAALSPRTQSEALFLLWYCEDAFPQCQSIRTGGD